jgi:hypothetical protein
MPSTPRPPEPVRRLIDDRAAAREARDWDRADALRDEIADLGWEVQDAAGGSTARPILSRAVPDESGAGPASLLDEAATVALSLQVVADDHPTDLARLLAALAAHPPGVDWELVVVANAPSFALDPLLKQAGLPITPVVVASDERLGWADSRTLGMRRSRGEITLLIDTSIEPTGEITAPILHAFEDAGVGLAGGWGVRSRDGRQFHDAPPGEVDAVESYCLAIRREALRAVGGFDHRFRFYRNADLDLSFAVRAAGWRAMRTEPLPAVQHEHRGYASLPDAERDRLSKRNFYRFLDRWRDRPDLLLDADAAEPDSSPDR